ncbi:hypothetical protein VCSRO104_3620 [Vibrio cholerae]|uniref:hypothetical protein n=1 Tax=Vibrio cholerae TaxID=666 RepID=UPI000E0BE739|nr:hypothetical protein [Vibrio cholerae]EKF9799696.1 hypothetical protein [Vibrio cholerae]TXY35548.1 hypothetical protein FXE83_05870 [Vibrio cholerae]GHW87342.1 hypothetical protein VCSRO104_3620 [Vibrio cholerae]
MLFADHFKRCDSPETVDKELARITHRQPLHIVAAIRRAASSRRDQLLKEAAEREAQTARREALEKRCAKARKSCFAHDETCDRRRLFKDARFDHYILTMLAKAVADDTNVTRPRRWLAKHDRARLSIVALLKQDFGHHWQLVKDYKEMHNAALAALTTPKPNSDGECVDYRIIH